MNEIYTKIEQLCTQRGINITAMCRQAGVSRGNLTDLKMGRQEGLSAKNMAKLADFFGVSVGWLLGTETEKAPIAEDARRISDEDIKFALFGGEGEISDAMYDEVRRFAAFVKQREAEKKGSE